MNPSDKTNPNENNSNLSKSNDQGKGKGKGPTLPVTNPLLVTDHEASSLELNQKLIHMEGLLAREKRRNKELNRIFKPRINKMNYEQLEQLQQAVLAFQSSFQSRIKGLEGSSNIKGSNSEK